MWFFCLWRKKERKHFSIDQYSVDTSVATSYLKKGQLLSISWYSTFTQKFPIFFNLIVVSGKTEGKRKRLTRRGWLQLPTWKPAPGLAAHLKAPKEARWSSAVQVKLALTALKCPFSCGQQGGMGASGRQSLLFSFRWQERIYVSI